MSAGYARPVPATSVDWMSFREFRLCLGPGGDQHLMVLWELLAVPGTAVLLIGLLSLSALVEQRVLCPRAMILQVARDRSSSPEFTETFVAREFERLLRSSST